MTVFYNFTYIYASLIDYCHLLHPYYSCLSSPCELMISVIRLSLENDLKKPVESHGACLD